MTRGTAAAEKAIVRRAVLARRRARPDAARQRAGHDLARALAPLVQQARTVAAYAALPGEPPTAPLLEALAGRSVLLPVLDDDGDLDWAAAGAPLAPGVRGTRHPAGPRLGRDALAGCDLVVVPALSVDRRGVRLGRGGGAYDRALRRARGLVVALVFDDEVVDRLPEDAHDVRIDACATPGAGLHRALGKMAP
ncbi:MAG TPA: 5-formyltetrahydrofolate cyclo-ligase [Mycobacteriales bacterium]|nr:5-formyltetrahydrofolate cyclo-ligase [Mycobacteriales bacterium]